MKISRNVLRKFNNYSKKSKCVNKPDDLILDHRLAKNPHLSLFGAEWEQIIKKSVTLGAYILITDMIKFMVGKSQHVMKGTYHEDDCFFTMMLCPS
jgi:hypothetical protein